MFTATGHLEIFFMKYLFKSFARLFQPVVYLFPIDL